MSAIPAIMYGKYLNKEVQSRCYMSTHPIVS